MSGWSYASLVTSILTLLISAFYVYKYRSTKASVIAGSASISVLASLISNAVLFSFLKTPEVKVSVVFFLRGVYYAFAFYTIFYAFHCILRDANQNGKLLLYIGYMWMAVTMSISLASAILMGGNAYYYSDRMMDDVYNITLFTVHSIWGFVAIALLLFFTNKERLNTKSVSTKLAFIGLTMVAAIASTVTTYQSVSNVTEGVSFFLVDLTIKAAILIAVFYGPTWIQANSIENDGVKTEIDGDLEANQESNSSN